MSARAELEEMLEDLAQGGGPVLEALARMNATALSQTEIDEQTALVARFGALVALDASPASYLVHLALAEEAGISPAMIKAVLVTLAPLVGSARIVSAADNVMRAIQLANRV
jgi:alkylhydroperoxidase/carboxymuconolactone decarboxylase family protein YurZ